MHSYKLFALFISCLTLSAAAQVKDVFVFPDASVHIEGVAFNEKDRSFYMGSVNTGALYRLRGSRLDTIALPKATPRWSVLGLAVDASRQLLYLTRCCLAESADTLQRGASDLLCYDLKKKRWCGRYEMQQAGRIINFNDLAFGSDGAVFISDSGRPGGLWMLDARSKKLRALPLTGTRSPQGLVYTDSVLYIADYARGIVSYRFADSSTRRIGLARPEGKRYFYDGLQGYKGGFIAVTNGPNKALLAIMASGDSLAARVLAPLNDARYNEPTLGVRVGSSLYFISNSQWESYKNPGERRAAILSRIELE